MRLSNRFCQISSNRFVNIVRYYRFCMKFITFLASNL